MSGKPWGGRHVILLGDPAQLPAVGQRDIYGTTLWAKFSVLVLREVKLASWPVSSVKFGWVYVMKRSVILNWTGLWSYAALEENVMRSIVLVLHEWKVLKWSMKL